MLIAKFVLAREIKVRIEQCKEDRLENWDIAPQDLSDNEEGFIRGAKSAIKNHQCWCDNRIAELESELTKLDSTDGK